MRRSGISKWPLLALLLRSMCTSACPIKKDSPAPACVQYWGPGPSGGCFGKTVILDLQLGRLIGGLEMEVSSGDGGILEVGYSGDETLSKKDTKAGLGPPLFDASLVKVADEALRRDG
jgi:hypothetical protein